MSSKQRLFLRQLPSPSLYPTPLVSGVFRKCRNIIYIILMILNANFPQINYFKFDIGRDASLTEFLTTTRLAHSPAFWHPSTWYLTSIAGGRYWEEVGGVR